MMVFVKYQYLFMNPGGDLGHLVNVDFVALSGDPHGVNGIIPKQLTVTEPSVLYIYNANTQGPRVL